MKRVIAALVLLTSLPANGQTQAPVPAPVPLTAPAPAPMPLTAPAPITTSDDDIGPPPKPEEAPPPPAPLEAPAPPKEDSAAKQNMSPPNAWVARTSGTFRVMNKIDSTVQSVSVPVGGTAQFQSLTIKLSGCFVRPPDLPADAAAHVDIADSRPGLPGLNAWILKNEPALNMLQHPVYDVQLAGCA